MFKEMWRYMRQKKWVYLLATLCLFGEYLLAVLPPKLIQGVVDAISRQTLTSSFLWTTIAWMVGIAVVIFGISYVWQYLLFVETYRYQFSLRKRLYHKLMHMRISYYEKFRSGDMMTRFTSDTAALTDFLGYGLTNLLTSLGTILFLVPAMFVVSWQITLLSLLPFLLCAYLIYKISAVTEPMIDEKRDAVADLSSEVLEAVEGVRVVRSYSDSSQIKARFRQQTARLRQKSNRVANIQVLYGRVSFFFLSLMTAIVIGMGGLYLEAGTMTLGQIVGMQLYASMLLGSMWSLSDLILVYQLAKISFGKVQELMETADDMQADGRQWVDGLEEIRLDHYSFSYAQASQPTLVDLSLTLKKGQTLGIVGPTGSGKTSLVRQFLLQYPMGSGTFTINGQDLTNFKRSSIEEKIGYVPQEHVLFSRSLKENLLIGKADADILEVAAAIETAAFTSDVEAMSDGIDTLVGEKGVSISGGQKQRLSIARAFIKNPELLILDDSLSAVDAKTEAQIIHNIQQLRSGETTIIVSHRLSAVAHADWILVLDQGRIVEEGRPGELLASGGWYAQQYAIQQLEEKEEN